MAHSTLRFTYDNGNNLRDAAIRTSSFTPRSIDCLYGQWGRTEILHFNSPKAALCEFLSRCELETVKINDKKYSRDEVKMWLEMAA